MDTCGSVKLTSDLHTSAYVWFDAEYTDLDFDRARLLQVAAILTDSSLNRLTPPDQDLKFAVKLEPGVEVSPWVRENLSELVGQCRTACAVDIRQIDAALKDWLVRAVGPAVNDRKTKPILAGNSIHADWFLVRKYLPEFTGCLHYRLLDVTSLKILWQDWFEGAKFDKEDAGLVRQFFPGAVADIAGKPHDAYYDVQASIAELNYYRTRMMQKQAPSAPNTSLY